MARLKHISAEEIAKYGVVAAPDRLLGKPEANKLVFDRLVRELVAVVVNNIIDTANELLAAEDIRDEQEAGRVSAEAARVAAEVLRASGERERVAAEGHRERAEALRAEAEGWRIQQEAERVEAEVGRVAAETERASETAGIVVRATVQAERAGEYAKKAEADSWNAQAGAVKAAGSAEIAAEMEVMTRASYEEAVHMASMASTSQQEAGKSAAGAKRSEENANIYQIAAKDALVNMQGGLAGKLDTDKAEQLVRDITAAGDGILTITTMGGKQRTVDAGSSARVLSGKVGNAEEIRFLDGETMQAKLNRGDFDGRDGVSIALSGMIALRVDDRGHLMVGVAEDASDAPPVRINEHGHLIYTV